MTFDVLIGGLDREHARVLENRVRRMIVDLKARDVLRIAVLPSDAADRWDVGVRRASGWSVTWFDSPIEDLPAQVVSRLRTL
jgi:hypothetical protein